MLVVHPVTYVATPLASNGYVQTSKWNGGKGAARYQFIPIPSPFFKKKSKAKPFKELPPPALQSAVHRAQRLVVKKGATGNACPEAIANLVRVQGVVKEALAGRKLGTEGKVGSQSGEGESNRAYGSPPLLHSWSYVDAPW